MVSGSVSIAVLYAAAIKARAKPSLVGRAIFHTKVTDLEAIVSQKRKHLDTELWRFKSRKVARLRRQQSQIFKDLKGFERMELSVNVYLELL